ncbi:MAG: hypothetical protein FWH15_02915 [Betaproteobacteria bacterium]|nr:hypothetical protein [Betaproteobacteria bacterium]
MTDVTITVTLTEQQATVLADYLRHLPPPPWKADSSLQDVAAIMLDALEESTGSLADDMNESVY